MGVHIWGSFPTLFLSKSDQIIISLYDMAMKVFIFAMEIHERIPTLAPCILCCISSIRVQNWGQGYLYLLRESIFLTAHLTTWHNCSMQEAKEGLLAHLPTLSPIPHSDNLRREYYKNWFPLIIVHILGVCTHFVVLVS